jgi:hypothetical protein
MICAKGGHYFYEKYLYVKDKPHCAKRIISFFSECAQVIIESLIGYSFHFSQEIREKMMKYSMKTGCLRKSL